ncbi:MAG: methionyl-tRNA formyltransferase [Bacteroidales bacterium]|nr:methionyl-tRNA formyltransferase [Bacteroidales bacterium]
MNGKDLRIVFFGTPEIAAIELEHLVQNGYNVVGVVTNEDKPQGRGKHVAACEVKVTADSLGLKVLQPHSMKDAEFLNTLQSLNADIQIVVAFRMLPKEVYAMPPMGTFNLHTSLLPEYRGAAPINRAIINGDKLTGITTFLLNDKTDCGEILLQRKIEITDDMNAGMLYDIMADKGRELITDTLELIAKGNFTTVQQDMNAQYRPAPKIFKQDTFINCDDKAENVRNFIRGMSPYPTAKIAFKDLMQDKIYEFKVFESRIYGSEIKNSIGDCWIENKSSILLQCADGILELTDLQLNGKKRMPASELIKGLRTEGILKKI